MSDYFIEMIEEFALFNVQYEQSHIEKYKNYHRAIKKIENLDDLRPVLEEMKKEELYPTKFAVGKLISIFAQHKRFDCSVALYNSATYNGVAGGRGGVWIHNSMITASGNRGECLVAWDVYSYLCAQGYQNISTYNNMIRCIGMGNRNYHCISDLHYYNLARQIYRSAIYLGADLYTFSTMIDESYKNGWADLAYCACSDAIAMLNTVCINSKEKVIKKRVIKRVYFLIEKTATENKWNRLLDELKAVNLEDCFTKSQLAKKKNPTSADFKEIISQLQELTLQEGDEDYQRNRIQYFNDRMKNEKCSLSNLYSVLLDMKKERCCLNESTASKIIKQFGACASIQYIQNIEAIYKFIISKGIKNSHLYSSTMNAFGNNGRFDLAAGVCIEALDAGFADTIIYNTVISAASKKQQYDLMQIAYNAACEKKLVDNVTRKIMRNNKNRGIHWISFAEKMDLKTELQKYIDGCTVKQAEVGTMAQSNFFTHKLNDYNPTTECVEQPSVR